VVSSDGVVSGEVGSAVVVGGSGLQANFD